MSTTTSAINLSSLTSVLGDIVGLFIQYLPLLASVSIIIGLIGFITSGLGNVLGSITGVFSGG